MAHAFSDLGVRHGIAGVRGLGGEDRDPGTKHTVEMLAFCDRQGITADVELLPSAHVETALGRLERGDVRDRFVLDLADLDEQQRSIQRCAGAPRD